MNLDLKKFQSKLEQEKIKLEGELSTLGKKISSGEEDWETTPSDIDILDSDKNEVGDRIEDLEERVATENELETQLSDVNSALQKIKNGTYGICEKENHPIDEKRLMANPSARTCLSHLK